MSESRLMAPRGVNLLCDDDDEREGREGRREQGNERGGTETRAQPVEEEAGDDAMGGEDEAGEAMDESAETSMSAAVRAASHTTQQLRCL